MCALGVGVASSCPCSGGAGCLPHIGLTQEVAVRDRLAAPQYRGQHRLSQSRGKRAFVAALPALPPIVHSERVAGRDRDASLVTREQECPKSTISPLSAACCGGAPSTRERSSRRPVPSTANRRPCSDP